MKCVAVGHLTNELTNGWRGAQGVTEQLFFGQENQVHAVVAFDGFADLVHVPES